jgi:putative transposase
MPRPRRAAPGGLVYHVLNRANARRRIFETHGDYLAFEGILADVQERLSTRILAWCLMPNHWHLVLWPREDGELSDFMRLVTLIHTQRWHAHRETIGSGHLYQGRFKSFAVQDDVHFLTVCRYVEANALRARLVARAEDWRWSSIGRAHRGRTERPHTDEWPVPRPSGWTDYVNEVSAPTELERLRICAQRGAPLGDSTWISRTVQELGLECTLRARGRPARSEKRVLTPFPEKRVLTPFS